MMSVGEDTPNIGHLISAGALLTCCSTLMFVKGSQSEKSSNSLPPTEVGLRGCIEAQDKIDKDYLSVVQSYSSRVQH